MVPKDSDLSELGIEQLERLRARVMSHGLAGDSDSVIPRLPQRGRLPLSFAQQRLWFLTQMQGFRGSPYHIPMFWNLRGQLDLRALRQSLDALWCRHESLRTIIRAAEGEPFAQLLGIEVGFPLAHVDLRRHPLQEEECKRICAIQSTAEFDVTNGPLVRGSLVQLEDDLHVLAVTHHHIITDGWSLDILIRELNELYRVFALGEPSRLGAVHLEYADYAAWQHDWLTGVRRQKHVDFWQRQLSGAPSVIELPTDRARPAQQSFEGQSVPLEIDDELVRRLRHLGHRHSATLVMTLVTAWAALLARLSNQRDVVIGIPMANRNRAETHDIVGFFTNSLPLRVQLDPTNRFVDVLAHVRDALAATQDHEEFPFEQIVAIVNPARRLDHTPIFQVAFTWRTTQGAVLDWPGVHIEPWYGGLERAKFDLELVLGEVGDRVTGHLCYATSIYDRSTIERYRVYFDAFLRAMVTDSEQLAARAQLLSPAETTLLTAGLSGAGVEYAVTQCLHHRFEQQAERTPEAIALVDEAQELRYRELNARANQLAHSLRKLGAAPEARVAVCGNNHSNTVVAMIAILKSGAAYVPLDIRNTDERLAELLRDCAPTIVLASARATPVLNFAQQHNIPHIVLDDWWQQRQEEISNAGNLIVPELCPQSLAYVIYTSGSTGTPKGVMVEHAQVVRLFEATEICFEFAPTDIWTLYHSFAFDFSVWEIWGALLHGGKLVIVDAPAPRAAADLHEIVTTEHVTVLSQTPSAFREFTNTCLQRGVPPSLRYIVLGGEALDPELIALWSSIRSQSVCVVNMYGITEITVHATFHVVQDVDAECTRSVIGRPLPDLRIYLLDEHRAPVPQGVIGEIWVSGAGVARGYWNRPELTATRFLPDPFNAGRMYRSGDLARARSDGTLEFAGRNDRQIKIRGYRIEVGEIEARLRKHQLVVDCAVIARKHATDTELIAYVVCVSESLASVGVPRVLREHAVRELPEYMVPAKFVQIESIPFTQNGKLDISALPMPDSSALVQDSNDAPRGDVEVALASAWCELLHLESVSRTAHFFELGGHSLAAVRLVEHLRRLKFEAELRTLIEYPVLADFASRIRRVEAERTKAVPIRRAGHRAPIFFVPDGLGGYDYALRLADELDGALPVYALPWEDGDWGDITLRAHAAQLVVGMKEVQPRGPYRIAGYSDGGLLAYAVAEELVSRGDTISFVGLIDTHTAPAHARTGKDLLLDYVTYNLPDQAAREDLILHADAMTVRQLIAAANRLQVPLGYPHTEDWHWEKVGHFHTAATAYTPSILPIPITLFHGTTPMNVSADSEILAVAANGTLDEVPLLGWSSVLPSDHIASMPLDGNHLSIVKTPGYRRHLAGALSDALRSAE